MSRYTEQDWQADRRAEDIAERYRPGGSTREGQPTVVAFAGGCCTSWLTYPTRASAERALETLRDGGAPLWEDAVLVPYVQEPEPGRLTGGTRRHADTGEELRPFHACPAHREGGSARTELR